MELLVVAIILVVFAILRVTALGGQAGQAPAHV